MLTYNTHRPRLILPEYGRAIQRMVDHCITIPDREERTRCAYSIISAMARIQPKVKEQEDWKQILWDHLAYMSGFKLDIDYPVEVSAPDKYSSRPEKVPYPRRHIRYRHYGKDVELIIAKAIEMPEGPERDELVNLVANHMKKLLLAVNKDSVDDAKIFKDLAEYSHGMLRIDPETTRLHVFNKPHGIKGEISATLDFDIDLSDVKCIVLDVEGIFVPFFIVSVRPKTSETVLITIDGIDSEQKARTLTGRPFYLLDSDIPEPDDADGEGGFYLSDLIGFTLADSIAGTVGEITDYNDATANLLLIVTTPDGEEVYIPVADEYIDEVDTDTRTLHTTLPSGIIDLNTRQSSDS